MNGILIPDFAGRAVRGNSIVDSQREAQCTKLPRAAQVAKLTLPQCNPMREAGRAAGAARIPTFSKEKSGLIIAEPSDLYIDLTK